MTVLAVTDIARSFGGIRAVDGVSFSVEQAEIVGIIGPNGSGKSTLFNLLTGTLKPSAGFKAGTLIAGKVGAQCDADRGFLLIGDADAAKNYVVAGYVLPGNNYHVYDITLFWANVRADALRRLATYEGKPSPVPPPAAPVAASALPPPPSSPRT